MIKNTDYINGEIDEISDDIDDVLEDTNTILKHIVRQQEQIIQAIKEIKGNRYWIKALFVIDKLIMLLIMIVSIYIGIKIL